MNSIELLQDHLIKNIKKNYKKYIVVNILIIILIFFPVVYYNNFLKGSNNITSIKLIDLSEEYYNTTSIENANSENSQELSMIYEDWRNSFFINTRNITDLLKNEFKINLKDKYNIHKIVDSRTSQYTLYTMYYKKGAPNEFINDIYELINNFNIDFFERFTKDLLESIKSLDNRRKKELQDSLKKEVNIISTLLNLTNDQTNNLLEDNLDQVINYLNLGNSQMFDVTELKKDNFREYSRFYYQYNNLIKLSKNYKHFLYLKNDMEYKASKTNELIHLIDYEHKILDSTLYTLLFLPLAIYFIALSFLLFILIIVTYFKITRK